MTAQLENIGFPFQFLNAIRPNLSLGWPTSYLRKKRLARYGYDLTQGEIGCYLSHRKSWQEFLDSGNALCCVIEDDAELQPHFTEGLIGLCKHANQWDIVRLYGIFNREYTKLFEFMHGYRIIDYFYQPSGLQGYVLNRAAAQQLLAHTETMFCAIDDMVDRDWEHKLRIYGIKPYLIREQQQLPSTIGNRKRPSMSIWKKLTREIYRSRSDLHKRCWVLNKRLKYIINGISSSTSNS